MAAQEKRVVRSHDVHLDAHYVDWIGEVKRRYRSAQAKAAVKVNSEQLLFNWELGRDLVTRRVEERWGSGVVEQASLDLQSEFPDAKGFSTTNLWYMKKWYQFYAAPDSAKKLQQLVGELSATPGTRLDQIASVPSDAKLQRDVGEVAFPTPFSYVPWGHHIEIVTHCKTIEEAAFYLARTIQEGWSRSALRNAIKGGLYQASGNATTNFRELLPAEQARLAQAITRDTYDLGFISLPPEYDERDLEDALERNITRFLLELGTGFAFVGRQREIVVSGKTRRIDMLFYHIRLRCYVVMELKVESFEPEFVGKLNFYVNAVDELLKEDGDNPTLGLLVCRDKDRTEVQWALRGIDTPMGVATYGNVRMDEIRRSLPTEEQIQQRVELAEREFMDTLGRSDS